MRYPESVEFLYSLGNEIRTVKFGLDSIRTLTEELGSPQRRFRVVHVAGTNGKGSTCAMIEAALRYAGYRTGLYTSPHLIEPTERIRIAGVPVTPDAFTRAFHQVHEANGRLLAAGRLEHHTTYFETVTAMGFLLMAEAQVDIAVVEVGLGGRLDATNVVSPELCLITPIDFDHEQYLGNSIEQIAGEKAGILKKGVPIVIAAQRPEARRVIQARAAELECPCIEADSTELKDLEVDARGSSFTVDGVPVRCPLAGVHQVENARTAITALRTLGVAPHIDTAVWDARLQLLGERPEILLDGAHNPAGARMIAEHIRRFYSGRRLRLIYGAMRDKSVQEIAEILFPMADEVIVTGIDAPRALQPEVLVKSSDHPNIRSVPTVAEAIKEARVSAPQDVVLITGSLYLAGEVLSLLRASGDGRFVSL